ncbi:helix-turn-helix domain-containing protein [Pusillimonas minor]|uniref:Helix-turn-helix domain-containing protein n=1 Tax=Pusillimonas minor TaxID=2697024 RepID=A0A842HQT2_9BURK|nr:helix-turn-helix domain-containing protein [Pusillimonas minor]MBC2770633.1 helix-turn-helix domain-containing protein [Pusillimonas minor]
MNPYPTAETLFEALSLLSPTERERFFSLLARRAFGDEDYTYEQTFGDLDEASFSAQEAADYLEVSLPTLRRYVQSGRLAPARVVGRSQMFATTTLQRFKQALRMVK